MFNAQALKAEIVRNGLTQREVAKSIGLSANTFSSKMKNGSFGMDEAAKMIELLGIKDAGAIFFARE